MMLRGFAGTSALLLLCLAGCGPRATPDPFYVGQLSARTGAERLESDQARNALLLAVAPVNKEPIAGRKVEVLHVNTQGKPTQAYAETVRLITVNHVGALLGGADQATAMQMAQAANSHNVPVVTPASLPRLAGLNNIFSINVTPEFHGKILARFAGETFLAKKAVVIVEESDPLNLAVAEAIRDYWQNKEPNSVAIVALPTEAGKNDLRKRLDTLSADVVFFAGSTTLLAQFSEQLRGGDKPKPLVYAGRTETVRRLLALDINGLYAATLYEPPGSWNEQQKIFAGTYRERFRVDPDEIAFEAFDGAYVLFEAMKQAKVGGARLREEIGKLTGVVTLSGTISFDKQHARRPLHLIELEKGQAKLRKTYQPD